MLLTLEVPGTFNTRIAGADADGRPWLLRSAALDALTPEGLNTLAGLGLARIVDLREPAERGDEAPRHGIDVVSVPLYQLPGGPPTVGAIGSVYRFLTRERAGALAQAVEAVATAEGPALVHCAFGKDRTGLIVALTLLASGAPKDAVLDDYAESAAQMPAERRTEVLAELAREGVDEHTAQASLELHLASPREQLAEVIGELEEHHGGVGAYLRASGLTARALEQLHDKAGRP